MAETNQNVRIPAKWLRAALILSRHIRKGQLKTIVYHGPSRKRLSDQMDRSDVILTTYETLRSDWVAKGPLYDRRWLRVVLDEGKPVVTSI